MIEELNDLDSSNVAYAMYDGAQKSMTVRFHNGTSYRYEAVSPQHWQNLKDSKSKGGYLHQHVVRHHKGTKLET